MEKHDLAKGPLKMLSPGRPVVMGNLHSHQFYQIEGLVIDKNMITMSDLKGTFAHWSVKKVRGRQKCWPSYLPFTEPSLEVDISCSNVEAKATCMCWNRLDQSWWHGASKRAWSCWWSGAYGFAVRSTAIEIWDWRYSFNISIRERCSQFLKPIYWKNHKSKEHEIIIIRREQWIYWFITNHPQELGKCSVKQVEAEVKVTVPG